jgi:hypothetical protein
MPTADATLLPPPFPGSPSSSLDDEPYSARSLDAVGVGTVLGAMIEHRRASQPSFSSIVVSSEPEPETLRNLPDDGDDEERREPVAARAATSEVFLKAR